MAINLYQVIKGPVLSPKAQLLNSKHKKLVLEVHVDANKLMIKQALNQLFNVQAEKINVVVKKGKTRRAPGTRLKIQDSLRKHAIVTLKAGQHLDLFGQTEVQQPSAATVERES